VPQPGPGEPEVFQITDAMTAHSADLQARMTRYLVSMLIRTVCVLLVFVVDGWLRWVFVAGAVGLPYVAVIAANNSGGSRARPANLGTPQAHRPGLTGSSQAAAGPDQATPPIPPPPRLEEVGQPRSEAAAADPGPDSAARPAGAAEPLRDSA
jgi:hypothetical protein